MEALLVPDDLNRYELTCLVVVTFQSLTETTLAKELKYFISVSQMVLEHNLVVSPVVIIAIVVRLSRRSFYLLCIQT